MYQPSMFCAKIRKSITYFHLKIPFYSREISQNSAYFRCVIVMCRALYVRLCPQLCKENVFSAIIENQKNIQNTVIIT